MSTQASKGWRTKIIMSGSPLDEDAIGGLSEAAQTTFYTQSFPVVDILGAVTDDENEIVVYDDGVIVIPANYTLTGSLGRIVFSVAPAAGSRITFDYSYRFEQSYGKSFNIKIGDNLEELHVLGLRSPKEILEGIEIIQGEYGFYHTTRDMVGKISDSYDGTKGQADFTMLVYPLGEVVDKVYFTIRHAKFGPFNLDIAGPDSVVEGSIPWKATEIESNLVV